MLTNSQSARAALLTCAAAIHLVAVMLLDHSIRENSGQHGAPTAMIAVLIRPEVRPPDEKPDLDLSRMMVPASAMMASMKLSAPPIDFSVSPNSGASVATPSLRRDSPTDVEPYIAQAALLPGEGATVVLRVEVLATGETGAIAVDVSSGSQQTDRAAVAYAQSQRWNPGIRGGMAQPMWIRWSVRFQA